MAKNVIGIDISDFSIEAVTLDGGRGGFSVENYSRFRLSPDIVEDGTVINKDKLKEALQAMLKNAKLRPMEAKKVFLSIPESKVFSKVFSLPKDLKDKNLSEAIKHKAEESIPEAAENLVAGMKVLSSNGDGKEILYSAAKLAVVKGFLEVFRELNMEVVGVTTESLSSFAGLDDKFKKTTTLLLDVGSRTTIASIFDNKGIRDSININIAGNNIVNAIAKKLQVSQLAAEEKMKQVGLSSAEHGEIMLVIQGQLQPVADELKRFVQYYEQKSGKSIEQIVLIGGLAQMKGIDKYFGDNLSKTTYRGEPFIHSKVADLNSTTYINALGLAKLAQQKPEMNFLDRMPKEQSRTEVSQSAEGSEEESKPVKKKKIDIKNMLNNKFIITGLVVVVLAILGFVFKAKLIGIFSGGNSDNGAPVVEEVAEQKVEHSFKQEVTIVDITDAGETNYLAGELLYIEEFVEADDTNRSYEEVVIDLEADFDKFDLNKLGRDYIQEGYYIIPKVLETETIQTEPAEELFVSGEQLVVYINYGFMTFREDKMRQHLAKILELESEHDLQDLQYDILRSSTTDEGHLIAVNVDGVFLK